MRDLIYPVLVFIAMAAWGVLHSWVAAFSTKRLVKDIFGGKLDRYYRLMFVGVAVLTLLPILGLVIFLPSRLLWVIPAPWVYGTVFIQLLAVLALLHTVSQTDVMAFVGLRQVNHPNIETESELVLTGFYRHVRHPLYLFSIVFFWLFPYVTDLVLAFILAGTFYFLIGMIPEERKLRVTFGATYEQYRREVPALIPFIKRKTGD
jgi:protein-S-isoprenylcysteine O-methyltransferase Ste14